MTLYDAEWVPFSPSGGGGDPGYISGHGSPIGVVTPDLTHGYPVYRDEDNGGLYIAVGPANTDWFVVGGNSSAGALTGVWANDTAATHIASELGFVRVHANGWTTDFKDDGGLLLANSVSLYDSNPGVPDNALGADGDWALSANGHIYFKTGGAWVQKV